MATDNFDGDSDGLRQRVQQLEAIIESTTDPITVKDREGRYQFVNGATARYLDREPETVIGATDEELFGEERGAAIRRKERAVRETERTQTFEEVLPVGDGERVFESTRAPYYGPDGDLAGTVTVYRDVTERKVRERALESQRDQLATLNRINEVARGVVRALIGEPTREEIARTVCDRLVESELYRVAWVGQPDPTGSTITDFVGSGVDDSARDLVETIDASQDSDEPVPTAYYSGEPQVVQSVSADETLRESHRTNLLDSGVESGIVVPIRYGDATYGVLAVGTDRVSAFSGRETDAFEVLGEVIGFAIGAVKHRQLALSDAVAELEFRLTDPDSFYIAATDRLDCTLELEGMAAGPDGTLLFYDTVRGADSDDVLELADDWDAVEDARLVGERGEGALLEFVLSGSSMVLTLAEYGANTTEAVTSDGEARIVAEVPAEADVREVVERVRSSFPSVELVAKRERERDVRTAREFRRDLADRLTDAQRTALRASYFAGYYEWPRDSTAEDVAASLGVSSPTFHQHIRKAQRELLATFFDAEYDRP
ncbi:PAS domain-containing protein [Halorussus salilacus]|uniref:bacterio-opsin activator domain-containing protein n=1 Tax=Halorussus salilacus TaxID=2953750 RepID=UPI0020A04982|nr:bacterio-opsin activator domain-containing protein [Halorussus salilacus]USZ69119.1 PAS domain-containing protein [Halorussus salilacus]